MPDCTFARCPCGASWITEAAPARLLRCPDCGERHELEAIAVRVRYVVDVPADAMPAFLDLVMRPGFSYASAGWEPLATQEPAA